MTEGRIPVGRPARMDVAEHLLTTRFRKTIWGPFLAAVSRYRMAQPGDRIAACLSGGKDSLLMAKCLQMLQKYSEVPFEVTYLSMDPGYGAQRLEQARAAWLALGLAPEVFETDVYSVVDTVRNSPCHVCAAMRRGHLYKQAQERGCNKIALGHHRDDAAETILLSILYGGQFKAMMPRLKSENYAGMQLIRPLYFVREKAVKAWLDACGVTAITCACRVTQSARGGKRAEIKALIAQLERAHPDVVDNIIASSQRVGLDTVLSYVGPSADPGERSAMDTLLYPEGTAGARNQVDRMF